MDVYYVSKVAQPDGSHEVHNGGCAFLPSEQNRIYVGSFDICQDAVQKAKEIYPTVEGCAHCLSECHIS